MTLRRDDAESVDSPEVGGVERHDAEAVGERGGRDPEVVRPDDGSVRSELRPGISMHPCHRFRDRHGVELVEDLLDRGVPCDPLAWRCAAHALEELAHRDDADQAVLVTSDRLDSETAALVLDEDAGVDQDGQGDSGGPTLRCASVTSRANLSSTGGSEAISSRNRSADTNRVFRGGPITATVAPLRVISISSPSAIRFRTAEKERATSVAVIRVTSQVYRINQI